MILSINFPLGFVPLKDERIFNHYWCGEFDAELRTYVIRSD
ncbi:MAG: hypothetical protein ACJA2S_005512, partial [Cyclobacteriaceae bacterium]